MEPILGKGDALVIVDVQRDFCPGGALPVADGDAVVPVLNRWITAGHAAAVPLYFSRDWHPRGHVSFKESGGLWPPHCIQDTEGAAFHPSLYVPATAIVITKGTRFDKDQNSAFDDTGLAVDLRRRLVHRLWVGGLALDVCVRATVLDALREGFETHLILLGTRPVDATSGEKAVNEMRQLGAHIVE